MFRWSVRGRNWGGEQDMPETMRDGVQLGATTDGPTSNGAAGCPPSPSWLRWNMLPCSSGDPPPSPPVTSGIFILKGVPLCLAQICCCRRRVTGLCQVHGSQTLRADVVMSNGPVLEVGGA